MGKSLASLLLFLSVMPCLDAQEPAPERTSNLPEPDHLVPLSPYPEDWERPYNDLWHEKLQVPAYYRALMVRRPSFEPESCLVILEARGESPTYYAVLTRASTNMWYWLHWDDAEGPRPPLEVERFEAPLPPELADRVLTLWERMLAGVRYPKPEDEVLGDDGETIEFRSRLRSRKYLTRERYGKTWSPDRGAPRLFAELGAALSEYCEAPAHERPRIREAIIRRCEALEMHLAQ